MVLQEYTPHPALREFIRTYRLVHFSFGLHDALPFKLYPPRPEHCLTFYAQEKERVIYQQTGSSAGNLGVVLFGQQTEVTQRFVGRQFLLIQVVFAPGALYRMTGIPSTEITNQYIDAETVFSAHIKYVAEQINHCTDYRQMISVVDRFLLNELRRRTGNVHRIDLLLQDCSTQTLSLLSINWLAWLARASGNLNAASRPGWAYLPSTT